jgi:hypothetical protein
MATDDLPDEWEIEGAWYLFTQAKEVIDEYIDGISASDVNHESPEYPRDISEEAIPIGNIEPLVQLTELLNQHQSTVYGTELSDRLDTSPAILSKIIHRSGYVKAKDAIQLLDRIRSFLLEIENSHAVATDSASDGSSPQSTKELTSPDVKTEKWVVVDHSKPVANLIESLTDTLEKIVHHLKTNNSLAELDAVSQLRIARLKAVLETTLKLLDAPMMEKGILKAAGEFSTEVAKDFAKDELKKGMGHLLSIAGDQLLKLYVIATERPF